MKCNAQLVTSDGKLLSESLELQSEFFSVLVLDDDRFVGPMLDEQSMDATPVGLSDWVEEDEHEGHDGGEGIWVVSADGFRAEQFLNERSTYLVSPEPWPTQLFVATVRVRTHVDDDGIGVVFGYREPDEDRYELHWLGNGLRIVYRRGRNSAVLFSEQGPTGAWEPHHT